MGGRNGRDIRDLARAIRYVLVVGMPGGTHLALEQRPVQREAAFAAASGPWNGCGGVSGVLRVAMQTFKEAGEICPQKGNDYDRHATHDEAGIEPGPATAIQCP